MSAEYDENGQLCDEYGSPCLDKELERELAAPCLYFRTGYVLKEDIAPTIDAVTARLLKREIDKGKGGQRRKLGSDCARERA